MDDGTLEKIMDLDIPPAQRIILAKLAAREGKPVSGSRLATLTNLSRQTVLTHRDRLESDGYLVRAAELGPNRTPVFTVCLT